MKPIEIIATDLFDKIRSRFSNLQMGDEAGAVTADPAQARFFDFDFAVEDNNLGRVSISINETGSLKLFFSQGITENADSITQSMWYDFLKEMRYFAKRRLLRFDTRDITKGNLDKTDFQYLAQQGNKDNNMNESAMFGSTKTSHRKLEDTDLIIRHTEAIDPTQKGARSRKIKNLFIQNKEGERFKFPFIYLPGARAMQRHVANGGYPHDEVGRHIIKTCEEILKLSDFGRKVRSSSLNDSGHQIAERAGNKLKQLRHHMECMSKQGYYESYCENYAPQDELVELDAETFESYKDAFTQSKFDEALAEVFPLLHSIMRETSTVDLEAYVSEAQKDEEFEEEGDDEVKEFAAFESWTSAVAEGTLEPDALMNLKDLLDNNPDLTIGADGTTGIEALEGVGIVDEQLEKLIQAKAGMQGGPEVLLKDVVAEWLVQDDPEAAQELGLVPGQQPAEQPVAAEPAPAEQPVAETVSPALQKVYDAWIHSEDAPYDDDSGDYNAVFAKAERFLQGKVKPEMVDSVAEKLSGMFHGEVSESKISENAYFGPEDFQSWLKDATHRVAHGKVADWTELYSELVSDLDFDENKAERIAKRIYGDDKLAKYRVKPTDDLEAPKDTDGEDDDAAFLAKLRSQARSGSIKQGADTGEIDETDAPQENPLKEVAKLVMGFYDRDNGTWTKGETGVVTHVKRQFSDEEGNGGEREAELAARLIKHLNAKHPGKEEGVDTPMEAILKLAGLVK